MITRPKYLLLLALSLIALVFVGAAFVVYQQFSAAVIKSELASQQKMTRIVNQSMTRYFETLKFVAENAVLHSAFEPGKTIQEDSIRFLRINRNKAKREMQNQGIAKILSGPRSASNSVNAMPEIIENWKLFKGLPEFNSKGELIAKERRTIARNVLKSFKDVHYVFEMDPTGDLVFLEPFEIQKNITSFNYEFRDYLRMVQATRATAISEGYISHDQNRTQIITIATPIFDQSGKVAKIFAVSVSATTLRDRVFRSLKENMDLKDGTTFYLVDRHGHIVASSSGKNIYFPTEGKNEDESDLGNLRSTGFFKNIDWTSDILEKGNIWERNTKSWLNSSLNKDYAGEYKNLNGVDVFATLFPTAIIGSEAMNWGILIETPMNQVLASKAYLKNIFYLSSLILIIILLSLSTMILRNFSRLESELKIKQTEIEQIASQVAHDIRSPLAALDMITGNLYQISEDKRILVRSAVSRIKDIANNLISKNRISTVSRIGESGSGTEAPSCQLISSIIDELTTEKRIQYRLNLGIEIEVRMDSSSYGLFANVQPTEFKRVISNLLNNSVEALGKTGKVELSCRHNESNIEISIHDNGRGIPAEILPNLMKKGVTFGKPGGTGLGLFHARTSVMAWGGTLTLSSTPGKGTQVLITLPRISAPNWFVPSLKLTQEQLVAVLDDDTSVHQIWSERFDSAGCATAGIRLFHFSTPAEFAPWIKENIKNNILCLVDFELLGHSTNGLAIIESLEIQNCSILVTSRYDEAGIRENCNRLNVRLIPKGMTGFIPIEISSNAERLDAVLIDDDALVHFAWNMSARKNAKQIKTFCKAKDFISNSNKIDRTIPIFIDSNLGNDVRGEILAKELISIGFENLYLTTGHPADAFGEMPWIKKIVGKEPPWQILS
jgi:signal transduction histidine kinase